MRLEREAQERRHIQEERLRREEELRDIRRREEQVTPASITRINVITCCSGIDAGYRFGVRKKQNCFDFSERRRSDFGNRSCAEWKQSDAVLKRIGGGRYDCCCVDNSLTCNRVQEEKARFEQLEREHRARLESVRRASQAPYVSTTPAFSSLSSTTYPASPRASTTYDVSATGPSYVPSQAPGESSELAALREQVRREREQLNQVREQRAAEERRRLEEEQRRRREQEEAMQYQRRQMATQRSPTYATVTTPSRNTASTSAVPPPPAPPPLPSSPRPIPKMPQASSKAIPKMPQASGSPRRPSFGTGDQTPTHVKLRQIRDRQDAQVRVPVVSVCSQCW